MPANPYNTHNRYGYKLQLLEPDLAILFRSFGNVTDLAIYMKNVELNDFKNSSLEPDDQRFLLGKSVNTLRIALVPALIGSDRRADNGFHYSGLMSSEEYYQIIREVKRRNSGLETVIKSRGR